MQTWMDSAREWLGITLTNAQVEMFQRFEDELLEWNQRFNLTAIRDSESVQRRHFLDSLSCLLALDPTQPPASLIDIGTGAGLPGIPLKILFPSMALTLVESIQKKANFCAHMVETLQLSDSHVLALRAEDIARDPAQRDAYALATARAVAGMPTLVEYLLPLVRVGGLAIMQKGANIEDELHQSANVIRLLGGRLRSVIPLTVPGVEGNRTLVVLEKIKPTPLGFPRRTGLAAKDPILN